MSCWCGEERLPMDGASLVGRAQGPESMTLPSDLLSADYSQKPGGKGAHDVSGYGSAVLDPA